MKLVQITSVLALLADGANGNVFETMEPEGALVFAPESTPGIITPAPVEATPAVCSSCQYDFSHLLS
jgi:hypothetical protein